MKITKILYVTHNSFLWGDNRALLSILDGVVLRGITPYVVMASKGNLCQELEKRNIPFQLIKNHFSFYPPLNSIKDALLFIPRLIRTLLYNSRAENKITTLINTFKPDIIHSNVGPVHIGFHVAKRLNIPHVWHIREYQDLDLKKYPLFSKNAFIKKLQSPINHNIAISKGIFEHYKMNQNATIISDGVLRKNDTRYNEQKENYFLFVGRLSEGKGVHDLIDAFIEFSHHANKTKLLIAGSGLLNYENKLKQKVSNLNLKERIVFLGFRKDVSDLMEKATALVVPSHFEGFGFVTVEAMFNGCLVIGHNTGGTKEILEKENLGILYSGHDGLVAAMKTVVENGIESYFPMIKKAQQRATELYSNEQNAEAVYQYYQEILNNR